MTLNRALMSYVLHRVVAYALPGATCRPQNQGSARGAVLWIGKLTIWTACDPIGEVPQQEAVAGCKHGAS